MFDEGRGISTQAQQYDPTFIEGNLFVVFGEPDINIIEAADGQIQIKVNGVDVFDPTTGEVRSDGADGIACWFIEPDYNAESFFIRHAYSFGANDSIQGAKDHVEGGNQRRRLGDAEQRHISTV